MGVLTWSDYLQRPARRTEVERLRHENEVMFAEYGALRDIASNLRHENEVQAAALESERQWRLNSLPALLDAERRANVAELERDQYAQRVDELMAELAEVKRSLYRLPWLSPVTEPGGRP